MKKREDMIRDVHIRINEYEAEKKMKRAKMTKVAASVTPVCAAAVVGVGLWKGGVLTSNHDQLISSTVDSTAYDTIVSADNDTSVINHVTKSKNDDTSSMLATSASNEKKQKATEADTTIPNAITESEVATENDRTDDNSADSNAPAVVDDNSSVPNDTVAKNDTSQQATEAPVQHTEQPVQQTEEPENRQTISSYPSGYASMSIPGNGLMGYGIELHNAMEKYSINADYSVKVDLFSESEQIFDSEIMYAEAGRLVSLGYNATVESEPMQIGEPYYYLTMKLTYEQIKDFPMTVKYGYAMRLYDESI